MKLRHKPTGRIFEATHEISSGHSGYRAADDASWFYANECDGVDGPGAKWHDCINCGYRWLEGMHGGHDCRERMRAEIKRLREIDDRLGSWLSAAIDDPQACDEFKAAVNAWMESRASR